MPRCAPLCPVVHSTPAPLTFAPPRTPLRRPSRRCGTSGDPATPTLTPAYVSNYGLNYSVSPSPMAPRQLTAQGALGINTFSGTEDSNFAFAELLVWSRALNQAEMYTVSAALSARYCLTMPPRVPASLGLRHGVVAPITAFATNAQTQTWADTGTGTASQPGARATAAGLVLNNGASVTPNGLFLNNTLSACAAGTSGTSGAFGGTSTQPVCQSATISNINLGGSSLSVSAWVYLMSVGLNQRIWDLGVSSGTQLSSGSQSSPTQITSVSRSASVQISSESLSDSTQLTPGSLSVSNSASSAAATFCSTFGLPAGSPAGAGCASTAAATAALPTGQWLHVTASHALPGGAAVLYVNGAIVLSGTLGLLPATVSTWSAAFLGASATPGNGFFTGVIGSFQARIECSEHRAARAFPHSAGLI